MTAYHGSPVSIKRYDVLSLGPLPCVLLLLFQCLSVWLRVMFKEEALAVIPRALGWSIATLTTVGSGMSHQ